MVSLQSNRQKIYYGELTGWQDEYDSEGYKTGEKKKTYSTPAPFLIYVSPAKGTNAWNPYGIGDEYSNVMSTFDRACPINEDSNSVVISLPSFSHSHGLWQPGHLLGHPEILTARLISSGISWQTIS